MSRAMLAMPPITIQGTPAARRALAISASGCSRYSAPAGLGGAAPPLARASGSKSPKRNRGQFRCRASDLLLQRLFLRIRISETRTAGTCGFGGGATWVPRQLRSTRTNRDHPGHLRRVTPRGHCRRARWLKVSRYASAGCGPGCRGFAPVVRPKFQAVTAGRLHAPVLAATWLPRPSQTPRRSRRASGLRLWPSLRSSRGQWSALAEAAHRRDDAASDASEATRHGPGRFVLRRSELVREGVDRANDALCPSSSATNRDLQSESPAILSNEE